MRQVLFTIPGVGIHVFGYGLMLFLAFLGSMTLAARSAKRQGLDGELIYDMALTVFIGGLVGARVFYVIQYWVKGSTVSPRFSTSGRGGSSFTAASSAARRPFSFTAGSARSHFALGSTRSPCPALGIA
ncbi:MAG: prolipoprotein diacylglyceryl transferase family protein [Isosphaeraceae bacterium]